MYRLVYDASIDGLWYWPTFLGLAVFPIVGLILFSVLLQKFRHKGLLRGPDGAVRAALFGTLICGPMVLVPAYMGYDELREYRTFVTRLSAGEYTIVEGVVSDFTPQRADGHPPESFRVDSHHYQYSPYELAPGYHTVQVKGGVIKSGLRVRIADIDGHIARLEVAQ
jgi:hypothetical protein